MVSMISFLGHKDMPGHAGWKPRVWAQYWLRRWQQPLGILITMVASIGLIWAVMLVINRDVSITRTIVWQTGMCCVLFLTGIRLFQCKPPQLQTGLKNRNNSISRKHKSSTQTSLNVFPKDFVNWLLSQSNLPQSQFESLYTPILEHVEQLHLTKLDSSSDAQQMIANMQRDLPNYISSQLASDSRRYRSMRENFHNNDAIWTYLSFFVLTIHWLSKDNALFRFQFNNASQLTDSPHRALANDSDKTKRSNNSFIANLSTIYVWWAARLMPDEGARWLCQHDLLELCLQLVSFGTSSEHAQQGNDPETTKAGDNEVSKRQPDEENSNDSICNESEPEIRKQESTTLEKTEHNTNHPTEQKGDSVGQECNTDDTNYSEESDQSLGSYAAIGNYCKDDR